MAASPSLSAEAHALLLRCWGVCLQYELARAELWSSCGISVPLTHSLDTPYIADNMAAMALRHITTEYLTAPREEVMERIQTLLRSGAEGFTPAEGTKGRLVLRGFMVLLSPLTLVANAVELLERLCAALLQLDELLTNTITQEDKERAAIAKEQDANREHLISAMCRWAHTRELRARLENGVQLAERRTAADHDVWRQRQRTSLIRRATCIDEEQNRQDEAALAEATTRLEVVSHTLTTIHEQLIVAQEYGSTQVALQQEEMTSLLRQIQTLPADRADVSRRIDRLEEQLGLVGRFAVGLSLTSGGQRGHESVLRSMQAKGISDDLTWLLDDARATEISQGRVQNKKSRNRTTDATTILRQCLLDSSHYKLSNKGDERGSKRRNVPSLEERTEVESALREAFDSLTRLNYMALPFLQTYSAELDALVLYPPFELFVTQCGMNVIGSVRLAFMKNATGRISEDAVAYMRSLVEREDGWIVEYALSYEDFIHFLVDQAGVEKVRHAYMLTPKTLLTIIVTEMVQPKWLTHLKSCATHPALLLEEKNEEETAQHHHSEATPNCRDLSLLLDTALTWLTLASRSLEGFALAYQRNVLEYAFATRPETTSVGALTKTDVLLPLLFQQKQESKPLRLCCNAARWDALCKHSGDKFVALSAGMKGDGSLDAVAAWISLSMDDMSREEIHFRMAQIIDTTLQGSITGTDLTCLPPMTYRTPISWILALSGCVAMCLDDNGSTPRLKALFRSMIPENEKVP